MNNPRQRKRVKVCPHCHHVHQSNDAIAIGLFRPGGPLGYRSRTVPDAPIRTTRAAAEADTCNARRVAG